MVNKKTTGYAYRKLRTNIEFNKKKTNIHSICLTSAIKGSGTTTISCELAKTFMKNKKSTLLIDCNINNPQIHKFFNINNSTGLTNLITNNDYSNILEYTYTFKVAHSDNLLYVLTSGNNIKFPIDLLSSDKFSAFMNEIKSMFDFVIIDCPSLEEGSDIIPVSALVDGTVLVVSLPDSDKNIVKDSIKRLNRNGVDILGTVLNKVEIK
ncbi:CpsD/CapB family tyrosine-protein kinase [uncultured Holdemanella sp.]|uniref:CpsD/CapB family tyrosine-protein kinase n=1 Tax=uncultured Holdemanella sp. TaxID=1763549 RepID=UPI002585C4CD|nr:CpsD/CapB family tyrosine-protein kinase [uncultured Holdemanella sp.]